MSFQSEGLVNMEFSWDHSKYVKDQTKQYHKIERVKPLMESPKRDEITTKFGKAKRHDGYYVVSGVGLHRLVYEDYYNTSLPPQMLIHHIDKNPSNNNIMNLIAVNHKEHGILHKVSNICNVKYPKDVECLQIISDNFPKIHKNNNRWIYEFEYGLFWKDVIYEKPVKKCAFADSVEQLHYLCDVSGLYWADNLLV